MKRDELIAELKRLPDHMDVVLVANYAADDDSSVFVFADRVRQGRVDDINPGLGQVNFIVIEGGVQP